MCNSSQLSKIIQGIVLAYRTVYGSAIKEILLYGSYARGDNDSQSDIDFVAIVDGDLLELQTKLAKVWDAAADLGLEHDAVISPVVIPYTEFLKYRDKLPYYRNIEQEGRRIG